MSKYIVAKAGVVTNIVNGPPNDTTAEYWYAVADATVVNVGDPFDPRQFQFDSADYVAGQILFNHENRIRDIVRAIRQITSTVTGDTAATNNGLPTTANSGDITGAQFKTAVINLLPAVTSVAPPHYIITILPPTDKLVY